MTGQLPPLKYAGTGSDVRGDDPRTGTVGIAAGMGDEGFGIRGKQGAGGCHEALFILPLQGAVVALERLRSGASRRRYCRCAREK